MAGKRLAAATVVQNPNTGAPTVLEAGAEVPDWAEDLIEDHLFEADSPREVAEDADVDDNAKPAVALAEEAGTVAVGVNPTKVEPADAGGGFATAPGPDTITAPDDGDDGEAADTPSAQAADGGSPAEEPKKTAARRRKASEQGDNQS